MGRVGPLLRDLALEPFLECDTAVQLVPCQHEAFLIVDCNSHYHEKGLDVATPIKMAGRRTS